MKQEFPTLFLQRYVKYCPREFNSNDNQEQNFLHIMNRYNLGLIILVGSFCEFLKRSILCISASKYLHLLILLHHNRNVAEKPLRILVSGLVAHVYE